MMRKRIVIYHFKIKNMNYPPTPYTEKCKPKQDKPNVSIDNHTDLLFIFAVILGFITIKFNRKP